MVAKLKEVQVRSKRRRNPVMMEALEDRTLLTALSVAAIATQSVPDNKTLFVPVTGTNGGGSFLNYSVASSSGSVTAQVLTGVTTLTLNVSYNGGTTGRMVFELFNSLAPTTVGVITNLVQQGFYNNLTFHRVVSGFVIQGGDPSGNGLGGPGFSFDDEFNTQAIFSGDGELAMANSGKDTNGSQFFVTIGPQRFLDFNHTIFGQLVEGFAVRDAIAATPVNATTDKPLQDVTITSATVSLAPTTDAVLMLTSTGPVTPSTITVTANDGNGHSTQQQFTAQVVADTYNDPPILGPVTNKVTTPGVPVTFALTSTDIEGDPVVYDALEVIPGNAVGNADVLVAGNQVTVTPHAGFVGDVNVIVGVAQSGATSRGSTTSPYDTQVISVTSNVLPTGYVDSITPTTVSGWVWDQNAGATSSNVQIQVDGTVIATVTASQFRGDLTGSFVGSPNHGFTYHLPVSLAFGQHTVAVSAVDTSTGQTVALASRVIQIQPALFDEAWYDAHNPDVESAIVHGVIPSGWFHYLNYGQHEGRDPSAYFSESYYLATYTDVAAAVHSGAFQSGFDHYVRYGQTEGRNPNPYFSEALYDSTYSDVASAIAAGSFTSGFQHFMLYGSLENRVGSTAFNSTTYLQKNPDVAAAVNSHALRSAWDHFMQYGRFEGRQAT